MKKTGADSRKTRADSNPTATDLDAPSRIDRRSFLKTTAVAGAAAAAPAVTLFPEPAEAKRAGKRAPRHQPDTIITREEARYESLRRGFNLRFAGDPTKIAYVRTASDVEEVLESAVKNGRGVTIRSGGHCYEGWCVDPGLGDAYPTEAIIDTSLMNEMYLEKRIRALRGSVAVGAGGSNWDLFRMMYPAWGFAPPAGSCYSVAAGGHFSGGGYGMMSRLQGMVVDHICGIEVVVVNERGRARTILVTENDTGGRGELFWAIRGGGGGNFGVVTRFYLKPTSAMHAAKVGILSFPWETSTREGVTTDTLADVLQEYGRYWQDNNTPSIDDPTNHLFAGMKVRTRATGNASIVCQWSVEDEAELGPASAPDPFIQHMIDFAEGSAIPHGTPQTLTFGWLEAAQYMNGSGANQRSKYKSAYMKETFTDTEARAITELAYEAPATENTQAWIQVDSYGGMINSVASDFNAYPHRESCLSLQWQIHWDHADNDNDNIQWMNDQYTNIYGVNGPMESDHYQGCYVNYCDSHLPDEKWPELYYLDNYPRLQRAKARWDPRNFFRFAQSIQPA